MARVIGSKFEVNDPVNRRLLILAQGDLHEAQLLRRAIELAKPRTRVRMELDSLVVSRLRRSFDVARSRGSAFREAHRLIVEAARLNIRRLAFSGIEDQAREDHSAFCYAMYQGYQQRFLDRHPGEEPEAFLDRARKSTMNLTRLVIRVLSQLYKDPPTRNLAEGTDELIKAALEQIWSEQFNLDLLEADRFTRLVGTVAVRPFFDPESPGSIRLWVFLSHQLRVIIDPTRPWKPLAVVERHEPFAGRTRIVIWTDRTFLTINEEGEAEGIPHGMGRIPLTFFRDSKSYTSFFVEGRGRGLCDQNAVINGKLTDINEVEQFQGFAVPIAINPEDDDITVGPRRVIVFKPPNGDMPFGLQFAQPNAPLDQLRRGIEQDIQNLLRQENVPSSALGAEIDKRALSGVAIKTAMQPIVTDNEERGRVFATPEQDLADNCLRVKARHEPGTFSYDPATQRPQFSIDWVELDFPLSTQEQIQQDEFDIAQAMKTPAQLMRERDPTKFRTHEAAVEQWKKNIVEIRSVAAPSQPGMMDGEPDAMGVAGVLPPIPEAGVSNRLEAEVDGNGNGSAAETELLDILHGRC